MEINALCSQWNGKQPQESSWTVAKNDSRNENLDFLASFPACRVDDKWNAIMNSQQQLEWNFFMCEWQLLHANRKEQHWQCQLFHLETLPSNDLLLNRSRDWARCRTLREKLSRHFNFVYFESLPTMHCNAALMTIRTVNMPRKFELSSWWWGSLS